jgi:hypothetical protein
MDWNKVVAKLRATSDQHATNAQNELMRGNKNMMEAEHRMSELFYGLAAAFEAGLEPS